MIFSHAHHLALVQTLCKSLLIRDKPAILLLGLDWIMHNLHRCFYNVTFGSRVIMANLTRVFLSLHVSGQLTEKRSSLHLWEFWPFSVPYSTLGLPFTGLGRQVHEASFSSSLTNLKSTAALRRTFIPTLKWQTL